MPVERRQRNALFLGSFRNRANHFFCRGFSDIIFFIRRVFGKLHVFHRSFDQVLVFISSALKHSFSIERANAHPEYARLAAQPLIIAAALAAASATDRSVDQLVYPVSVGPETCQ